MTPTDKLSELLAAATPGPWHKAYLDSDGHDVREAGRAWLRGYQGRAVIANRQTIAMVPFCDADHDFDAALIAMAPDLAAEVLQLRAQVAAADRLVQSAVRLVDVAVRISEVDNDNRMMDDVADTQSALAAYRAIRGGVNG